MRPIDQWRRQAKFLTIRGHQIAWWSDGDDRKGKPWLLLIHGYPTSSWDWTAIWSHLTPHFRLAALDMLGFGLSDKPRGIAYSMFDQADLQESLLEHLDVREVHLLTHDYGDTVGQELLARQVEGSRSISVKSICFLNGGLFPEQQRVRFLQKLGLTPFGPLLGLLMTRDRLRTAFDEIFGDETKASDEEIDGHWSMISEKGGAAVLHKLLQYIPERRRNRSRWVGALEETTTPLRLINGGADPVSGEHLYRCYLESVPNADAVLMETIGHYPQTEAPREVSAAFLEFHKQLGTIKP